MINDLRSINKAINDVVNYIVKTCCEETTTGNWSISYNDVSHLIGEEDFNHFYSVILDELERREEVLDLEGDYVDSFDINLALNYCPNYEWCPGDEEIFGSFEEFEKREILPVSQPISLTEKADAAERRTVLLYNSISLLADKVFEEYESVEELNEMLCEELGTSLEELKSLGITIKPVDEPEIIGSITYHDNNEVVNYTDRYKLIVDFSEALYVYGPNGATAKVYADDEMLKYQLDATKYSALGEDLISLEEWKKRNIENVLNSLEPEQTFFEKTTDNVIFLKEHHTDGNVDCWSCDVYDNDFNFLFAQKIPDNTFENEILLGDLQFDAEAQNILLKIKLEELKAKQEKYPFDEKIQATIDNYEKKLGIFERDVDTSKDLYIGNWRVHLVPEGGRYGLNNNCINENERTLIEFYDVSQDKDKFPEGQFTGGRYYVETILCDNGVERHSKYGLRLDGDVPAWYVNGDEMREVFNWLAKQPLKAVDKPHKSFNDLVSSAENKNTKQESEKNEYYPVSDGFFNYYVNKETGEKKFKLDKEDVLILKNLDDFHR